LDNLKNCKQQNTRNHQTADQPSRSKYLVKTNAQTIDDGTQIQRKIVCQTKNAGHSFHCLWNWRWTNSKFTDFDWIRELFGRKNSFQKKITLNENPKIVGVLEIGLNVSTFPMFTPRHRLNGPGGRNPPPPVENLNRKHCQDCFYTSLRQGFMPTPYIGGGQHLPPPEKFGRGWKSPLKEPF